MNPETPITNPTPTPYTNPPNTDPTNPNPEPTPYGPQKVANALTTMQPGERHICEIKRHPVGLLFSYAIAGLMIIGAAAIAFIVAPGMFPNSKDAVTAVGTFIFLIVTLLAVGFVFITNKVYWGNSWVLTSDSITQVNQTSLFNRQSSQLSLENLEDVTAEQNGILPHMFNYGTIKAETAGERSKFVFYFCPNPNYYAQQVLQAREEFVQAGHHGASQNTNQ